MHFPSIAALLRLAPCASLLIVLLGCANTGTVAPKDIHFDANSSDSFIILGTRVEINEQDYIYVNGYSIGFSQYNPDTFMKIRDYVDSIDCLKYFQSGFFCKDISWHFFRIPAGRHAFMGVSVSRFSTQILSTVFTDSEFHSLGNRIITGKQIYGFQTEPGKIYYLGNYVFDLKSFPARIVRYYVDMDAALYKLKEFKNISGDINHITIKQITK